MKKILTIILLAASLYSEAQGPVIVGTYLPVRGTAVKEVWDTIYNSTPIPYLGQDTIWDYSSFFQDTSLTYKISTFAPNSNTIPTFSVDTPFSYTATHASYLRAPSSTGFTDSLYNYYIIDSGGLYMLGGRSMKAAPQFAGSQPDYYIVNDTNYKTYPRELYAPSRLAYGEQKYDTSLTVTSGKAYTGAPFNFTIPINVRSWKQKDLQGVGYGTLIMPNGYVYNDVLLARIEVNTTDSIFDTNGSFASILNSYGVPNPSQSHYFIYSFLRNNTFGSSTLMYIQSDAQGNFIRGWYTLPVDFGFISGTVYTDLSEATPVTSGEARLYRENSNFTKHDILATSQLDGSGNYKFDSIPYGIYRVAIRADTALYDTAFTTYFGDTTDWLGADSIITFNDSASAGHKIHLQYYPDTAGNNQIQGQLSWNFAIRSNNPIPGIDVVVQKKPAGNAYREPQTDSSGVFTILDLPDGEYRLFVDIPGCLHATTYDFCVYNGQVINVLDFQCGTDSLHTINTLDTSYLCDPIITSIATNKSVEGLLQVYPNPYTSFTTVKVDLAQASDISLEVYNTLGEKVQVLDSGVKQAGNYSYNYSAMAIHRPAGIYLVRLIVNGKISVLKIVEH